MSLNCTIRLMLYVFMALQQWSKGRLLVFAPVAFIDTSECRIMSAVLLCRYYLLTALFYSSVGLSYTLKISLWIALIYLVAFFIFLVVSYRWKVKWNTCFLKKSTECWQLLKHCLINVFKVHKTSTFLSII